jgi:3-hydroxyacyl-[acyl-carrier-protein] dehydratase
MNQEEIMKIIPHRDSMLLIDEVSLIEGIAHGKKKIIGDEGF